MRVTFFLNDLPKGKLKGTKPIGLPDRCSPREVGAGQTAAREGAVIAQLQPLGPARPLEGAAPRPREQGTRAACLVLLACHKGST